MLYAIDITYLDEGNNCLINRFGSNCNDVHTVLPKQSNENWHIGIKSAIQQNCTLARQGKWCTVPVRGGLLSSTINCYVLFTIKDKYALNCNDPKIYSYTFKSINFHHFLYLL